MKYSVEEWTGLHDRGEMVTVSAEVMDRAISKYIIRVDMSDKAHKKMKNVFFKIHKRHNKERANGLKGKKKVRKRKGHGQ